jgi:hypothetical protein
LESTEISTDIPEQSDVLPTINVPDTNLHQSDVPNTPTSNVSDSDVSHYESKSPLQGENNADSLIFESFLEDPSSSVILDSISTDLNLDVGYEPDITEYSDYRNSPINSPKASPRGKDFTHDSSSSILLDTIGTDLNLDVGYEPDITEFSDHRNSFIKSPTAKTNKPKRGKDSKRSIKASKNPVDKAIVSSSPRHELIHSTQESADYDDSVDISTTLESVIEPSKPAKPTLKRTF